MSICIKKAAFSFGVCFGLGECLGKRTAAYRCEGLDECFMLEDYLTAKQVEAILRKYNTNPLPMELKLQQV